MKNSNLLIVLVLLLSCSVFCQSAEKKVAKTAYRLQVLWPVASSYWGGNFTKSDFPLFNGDNFAINNFYAINEAETQMNYLCSPQRCPFKPLNVGKIELDDAKYLEKYFFRFGLNNHNTTKELWNHYGTCYNKTQSKYFSTMVQSHKKFDLMKALSDKGIVPHKTKLYEVSDFEQALSEVLGGQKPVLQCATSQLGQDGVSSPQRLRYFNIYLDSNLNPTQENTMCNYEYCVGSFVFPPLEF